ncbi:MAG: ferrous iron transport protein B [Ferruginibacter sp.]|nr:ferrous iron transport protein B [Ferruginibacter sp.]
MPNKINIALVGNPNSGKTSLFNALTGLNQQVGNFPGVTVDKKSGNCKISETLVANIIDLPGTYSLYPKRADEWVAYNVIMGQDVNVQPDIIVLVADASNLKRNLLFCSQIIDLKTPVVIALSMMDLAKQKGTQINIAAMEEELGVPIIAIGSKRNKVITPLKIAISKVIANGLQPSKKDFFDIDFANKNAIEETKNLFDGISNYKAQHYIINNEHLLFNKNKTEQIDEIKTKSNFNATKTQADEIIQRFAHIKQIMNDTVVEKDPLKRSLVSAKIDDILLHRFWGYIILLSVLFVLFQSVFWLAQFPMDGIEWTFGKLSGWLANLLPQGIFADVFINGIVAGLSGIFIFVPQIMILFGLITMLEDTGYMARISFLSDKLMRKVGLNGKSIMPMISGYACAVPAIMSARNIENKKERLLTILITPLMSCSARLPVYTILISLVIPSKLFFGILSLQGLVMMLLYLLGTLLALLVAWVAQWFIKSTERSFFILELPIYRSPRWKNVATTMLVKAKIFVFDAGKIIMIISIGLWVLSTFGPAKKMQGVSAKYNTLIQQLPMQKDSLEKEKKAELLQSSFAGIIGKSIEPAILPLGYDWKIGIALITSFAAREVFVGTMATLYSVGDGVENYNNTLRQKMIAATRANGSKVYTLATGLSLLVFYVIAMQCMSTLVIVKRETKTWKWPIIQFLYMTSLAYLLSFITYQIFK